jgi:myo-inositol 2-dehydrogenase / D-chiro-inositol 1-dehydrogenase
MNAPRQTTSRPTPTSAPSRREFLKQTSGALTGAALLSALSVRSYAAENNTIPIALIGCGGRGTGAAVNALATDGPVKLVAMADVFADRLEGSLANLKNQFGDAVDVPPERQFLGMDAYRKAIAEIAPGGVAVLATPPAFRPVQFEHAVASDCHVFMEKSFAVDAPGVRRVIQAGQEATKRNLKVAGGLMSRHSPPLEEAVRQIHDGAIGEVITCWAYRMHGPVGVIPKRPDWSELEHQIRNYSCFTWVNGSFILDWLIHNLDVCCWVKDAWPVKAQGQGGRQVRGHADELIDQLFDHYAVEYEFADGTRMFAQGRHMANCWGFFGDVIHGSKGCGVLGEGINDPKLYRGFLTNAPSPLWQFDGDKGNQYQLEHDRLFAAIRSDTPYNETERSAYAAMTGILGRMAAESGQMITWDEAMASDLELAPGLDDFTLESDPPVKPDAQGNYPIAMPGFTTAF